MPTEVFNLDAAMMYAASPSVMLGHETNIGAARLSGSAMRSLLRVDISSIPAEATIDTATLSPIVETNLGSPVTLNFAPMLRAWVEGEVTWIEYADGLTWDTAGGMGAGDYDSKTVDSVTYNGTTGEFACAVPETVADAIANRGGLYSVVWWRSGDTAGADGGLLAHSDDAVTPANRPTLTIGYTLPAEPGTGGGAADAMLAASMAAMGVFR